MLKGFEVHFRKFWYIDGWVIITYPMRPICKIGCILENLAKKAPNLPQIGCFLQKNGIEMGHKITLFEVIEMVEILNSTLSMHPYELFWRTPPPGRERAVYKLEGCTIHTWKICALGIFHAICIWMQEKQKRTGRIHPGLKPWDESAHRLGGRSKMKKNGT